MEITKDLLRHTSHNLGVNILLGMDVKEIKMDFTGSQEEWMIVLMFQVTF